MARGAGLFQCVRWPFVRADRTTWQAHTGSACSESQQVKSLCDASRRIHANRKYRSEVSSIRRRGELRQSTSIEQAVGLTYLMLVLCFSAQAERLPLKAYTTADGMPHNVINKIVRDSRGFLWFCTEEGLSRFDGYTFTNYGTSEGLPHPAVNDILETRAGEYWVATNGGLVRFNPKGAPTVRTVYANEAPADAAPMFNGGV